RAEISDRVFREFRLRAEPSGRVDEAMTEKIDIENILAIRRLFLDEKIEEHGADARFLQRLRDVGIARAQPAAAAPMREENDTFSALGYGQRAFEQDRIRGNPYLHIRMLSLHNCLPVCGYS